MVWKFRKLPSYLFVKGVLTVRCTDNLSNQRKRYTQPEFESSSWYTVMYVNECLLSQLVVGNILLHLLMITHDPVHSISSDIIINQKCSRHLRSLKQLPQLIVARELGHCKQTMVVDLRHTWNQKEYVTSFGKTHHLCTKINIEKYVITYSKCNISRRAKAADLLLAINL